MHHHHDRSTDINLIFHLHDDGLDVTDNVNDFLDDGSLDGAARDDAINRLLDAIPTAVLERAYYRRDLTATDGPAAGGDVRDPAAQRRSDIQRLLDWLDAQGRRDAARITTGDLREFLALYGQ